MEIYTTMRRIKQTPTTIIIGKPHSPLVIMMIGYYHENERGNIILNDTIATAMNSIRYQQVADRLDIYDRTKCPGLIYLDNYNLSHFLLDDQYLLYKKPTIRELILWRQYITICKKVKNDSYTIKFIER